MQGILNLVIGRRKPGLKVVREIDKIRLERELLKSELCQRIKFSLEQPHTDHITSKSKLNINDLVNEYIGNNGYQTRAF